MMPKMSAETENVAPEMVAWHQVRALRGGEMTAVEHCRYKIEEIGGQPLEG